MAAHDTETKSCQTDNHAGEVVQVPQLDPAREAKVVAKLDLFLTPVVFIVYLSCFIDRANIGMWTKQAEDVPRNRLRPG